MKATILSCTLKHSPAKSNSEALADVLVKAFEKEDVETEVVRLVDHAITPGVSSAEGDGDKWPQIREKIVSSQILVFATPTWLGRPSSVAQKALERMDHKKDWSKSTGEAAAANLLAVYRALEENPIPAGEGG